MTDTIILQELVSQPPLILTDQDRQGPLLIQESANQDFIVMDIGRKGDPGIQGIDGLNGISDGVTMTLTAGANLSGHSIVKLNALRKAVTCDCGIASDIDTAIGMTLNAANENDPVDVIRIGEIVEPGWTFTPDQAVFLAHNGLLTQSIPTMPDSEFLQVVGLAINSTTVFVSIRNSIKLS